MRRGCLSLPILLALALGVAGQSAAYNQSVCADIEIDGLHYYINVQESNQDLSFSSSTTLFTYNLCRSVEVYCPYQNAVFAASMVAVNPLSGSCTSYTQAGITFLDGVNATSGIKVQYLALGNNSQQIYLYYGCNATSGVGCPSVQSGLMWDYFNQNVITYTITIEVVGVILMVLGIYIYRGSIVLIGWGTCFIILIMIESLFVFLRGVPGEILENVLAMTIIASFFVGYILGYFPKAGIFCMGLWIGFVITLTLNNVLFYYMNTNPPNLMLYIVTPILSIGFGILILCIKKTFIIFASSLIGSYLCLRALSWSLGAFPNEFLISKQYHNGLAPKVPWQFYLYVIALLILTASSSALQNWLFRMKMKRDKQSGDIEDHLDKMENTLKKEREQLIEIKSVFKDEPRQPRVLARQQNRSGKNRMASIKSVSEEEEEEGHLQGNARESELESLPPYRQSESEGSGSGDERQERKNLKENLLDRRGGRR